LAQGAAPLDRVFYQEGKCKRDPTVVRLKSRPKFNDINVRFDSSCSVLVIEDQRLGDESKCDFTQGAEQVASANRRFLMRCCRLQRTAFA
jgi:hypothetical protein